MLGAAISAIGSVAGGLLSSSSASKAAQKNYEAQKEFAQNGIRWKVEDAKAAGIHPLAALGTNSATFSPSYVAGDNGLAQAGQYIGNAVEATATRAEKRLAQVQQQETYNEQLRGLRLDNDIRAEQLLQMKLNAQTALQRPSVPSMPSVVPSKASQSGFGDDIPAVSWLVDPDGHRRIVSSQEYRDLYEDTPGLEFLPHISSSWQQFKHANNGDVVNGFIYDPSVSNWVPFNSNNPRHKELQKGRKFLSGKYWRDAFDRFGKALGRSFSRTSRGW